MQFPSMKSNPKYTLRVPSFDGGINTSLNAKDIQDNQVVSMSNMWLKDGVLQTRPSFKGISASDHGWNYKKNKWRDLNADIKMGFQSYGKNGELIGDVESHTYKLVWSAHKLSFLDISNEEKSYIEVPLVFQKKLYENCYNDGRVSDVFFFSGTQKNKKLTKVSGEYKEVFYTEIRGYITIDTSGVSALDELDGKPIKLFFYFVPVLDGDNVKASFEVFNAFKDVPEEYQPYQPVAITNYDTPYAEYNEDINLLHDKFVITRDINNDISKLETEDYENPEFVDRKFGRNDPNEVDTPNVLMTAEYGNEYRWQVYTTTVPRIGDSDLSAFIIYGKFDFKQFKTKNWTRAELSTITGGNNVWAGLYIENDWEFVGRNEADVSQFDFTGVTKTVAKATKLVFTRNSEDPNKYDGVFYNAADEVVKPDDIRDDEGNLLPYLCSSSKVWAEIKNGELKVILPQSTYDYLTVCYYNLMASYSVVQMRTKEAKATCELMGAYIDNIEYYCYTKDHDYSDEAWKQQNQSDLITRNDIKIWYGGTNSGYADGTRLFVAGHPEYQNVLRWSNVNNSSYFPENNFAYIGRDDEKITALGKQDGYMVVFKDNETYAIDYAFTTDEADNTTVYFPISTISPYIGCDCPGSIQLISSKLTWLSSNGKVYVLYSQNSYSERNIREISKHIEKELKQFSKDKLKKAISVDFDNKYFLFIDKTAYIWDYDRNPYYNYTSSEQAQSRLCWYKWELPYPIESAYVKDKELYIIFSDYISYNPNTACDYCWHRVSKLCQDSDKDSIKEGEADFPVTTKLKSKLFDFNKPFSWKNINRAFFELGNAVKKDGTFKQYFTGDIEFSFYTSDAEEAATTVTNRYAKTDTSSYVIRPHTKRVKNIGFCIKSECPVRLLSAEISSEIYGEVK